MMSGLGSMAQRRLGDGPGWLDSRRVEALCGVVVTSTTGTMKIKLIFILRISQRFDGGDGFCSVCMRCSLRTY
jgi:hypothetical protein